MTTLEQTLTKELADTRHTLGRYQAWTNRHADVLDRLRKSLADADEIIGELIARPANVIAPRCRHDHDPATSPWAGTDLWW